MRTTFLTYLRMAIVGVAVLSISSITFAQGEVFTDCDAWTAAVCGEIIDDDFESLVDLNGDLLTEDQLSFGTGNQVLSWASVTSPETTDLNIFRENGTNNLFTDNRSPLVFDLNADLLPFEGFCFDYASDGEVTFSGFAGDTLVVTETMPATGVDFSFVENFGWRDTEGLGITRIEISVAVTAEGETSTIVFGNGQVSFGEICDPEPEPEPPTCFEMLGDVKTNTQALLPSLSGDDLYFAESALDCIWWMRSDSFWEQPSGNRLTRYGGTLFVGAAYTILYLEWVDDPAADVLIDELTEVLECIVDNEILYAIENDGDQCFIDRAEDFSELGDIIDDDFDNEVIATLAYRLAWLNAFYATD